MIIGSSTGVPELLGNMTRLPCHPIMPPDEKVDRLAAGAQFLYEQIQEHGTPNNEGEYLRYLRIKTILACMPSLLTIATERPHTADVSEQVLELLKPTLREAIVQNTHTNSNSRTGSSTHGQIAEMAVLGTLLWAHSTNPERARHTVLPAAPNQDSSETGGRYLTGFDLILDMGNAEVVPIQVKSSASKSAKPYRRDIAIVQVAKLIDPGPESRRYAPQLLGDAVVHNDEQVLEKAIRGIDIAISKTQPSKGKDITGSKPQK